MNRTRKILMVIGLILTIGSVAIFLVGIGYCVAYYAITGDDIIQEIDLQRVFAAEAALIITGLLALAAAGIIHSREN